MRYPVLLNLSVVFFSLAPRAEVTFYSELESQSYSDVAPIDQIAHGLVGPPVGAGEFAFTHNHLALGLRRGPWDVSYFSRLDHYLRFNRDTARLIYLDKNDVAITESEEFDVYLEADALRAQGLGVGYEFQLSRGIGGRLGINYLYASEMTDGVLWGKVETSEAGYRGDLELDYAYSRDRLLSRDEESVTGHGVSLDLDLFWSFNQTWRLRLRARDIYSRVRWSDLTHTRASATTDTISYDANGTLHSVPGVAGIEGYRQRMQTLPARYTLGVDYPLGDVVRVSAELFGYAGHRFPRLALGWRMGSANLEASYDFAAGAIGLSVRHSQISILLRTDDLDVEKAGTLELALRVQWAFDPFQ